MTTIYDVAKRAGVSVKTVSRVLNDYRHVSEKTRSKVRDTMAELQFAPSAIAKQMRQGVSNSIGTLYGDPGSAYQSQLNHALLRACVDAGRYLAVQLLDESKRPWLQQVAQFLDDTQVRAMILVPPLSDSVNVHKLLIERNIDFVLISPSQPVAGASAVAMDDRLAAQEITEHLIAFGHKRLAHIAGDEAHVSALSRRRGFFDAIESGPKDVSRSPQIEVGGFDFRRGMDCAEALLSQKERPTAIFAANDHMALAVMMAAHRRGIRIPEDLSIAGFDNTPMGQSIWPTLTTVAQPFDAFAQRALRLLGQGDKQMEGLSAIHILPHQLVVRGSTGPAPKD